MRAENLIEKIEKEKIYPDSYESFGLEYIKLENNEYIIEYSKQITQKEGYNSRTKEWYVIDWH